MQPVPARPPTLEETRREMGIPSRDLSLRGQRDTVGYASRAEQMARVWELSAGEPSPRALGSPPAAGVAGVLCPHDDYLYAGRVYRRVLPLVTARTVILVGVFHRYRRFGEHDRLVFDPYAAWRTPDGPVPVSSLREAVLARLPAGAAVQDAGMHDSEHSLEALVFWLRHERPDLEILPVIVPEASFERFDTLARALAGAVDAAMRERHWALGRDVAVAISTDAVHYGADFHHTPFGEAGQEAYDRAVSRDVELLTGPLRGTVTAAKARTLFETFVDPAQPGTYRLTWCGRFSVPFGLLFLEQLAQRLGSGEVTAHPLAYATSVSAPELAVRDVGLAETAPATLAHFVGYPAVAFTTAGAGARRRSTR